MCARVKERFRTLVRRAGVGEVSPLAVAAAGLALGAVVVVAAWVWLPRGGQGVTYAARSGGEGAASSRSTLASGTDDDASSSVVAGSQTVAPCVVHVVGAVRQPGVYELRAGQRVTDAVAAAGGFQADAAQDGVNQAQVLQDGEQVVVPTRDEVKAGAAGAPRVGAAAGGAGGALATRVGAGAGGAVVNLNTADAAALDTLPGIGPSTAAKIVADRAANGPFKSADDLGRVPGIGPKKLEQLKGLISVR